MENDYEIRGDRGRRARGRSFERSVGDGAHARGQAPDSSTDEAELPHRVALLTELGH
jgi:hypothetical protein